MAYSNRGVARQFPVYNDDIHLSGAARAHRVKQLMYDISRKNTYNVHGMTLTLASDSEKAALRRAYNSVKHKQCGGPKVPKHRVSAHPVKTKAGVRKRKAHCRYNKGAKPKGTSKKKATRHKKK